VVKTRPRQRNREISTLRDVYSLGIDYRRRAHVFVDYVEDTAASEDEQSHFRPVEELIQFDGEEMLSRGYLSNS